MSATRRSRIWSELSGAWRTPDGDPAGFSLAIAQVPALLCAAAIIFVATNWVLQQRFQNWILPVACIASLVLLSSLMLVKPGSGRLLRRQVTWAHIATGLSALALITATIAIADGLRQAPAAGLVLICLNATMVILVGLTFSSLPAIGTLQLLITGVPGMVRIFLKGDPDAIVIGLMFVGIMAVMMRIIARANAERNGLAEARQELARATAEAESALHAAQSADRAKSEFLANMSHEIRTPMNGVLGMAELLAQTELHPRQKAFTDIIVKSGNALLTIINDVLDFSRIEAGELALEPAPFKLVDAVEDVATLMSARAAQKDLELVVRIDPHLPDIVVGDGPRFRQVITNLVGNAVKFTEAGHVLVEVSGRSRGNALHLAVSVEDTGIGIAADRIDVIFERFAQVDGSSTRRHEGTGLGLAIASRLAALMGGEIGVESRPGEGSAFRFTAVLAIDESAGAARKAPAVLAGKRILVVGALTGGACASRIRSWGFDTALADSGSLALRFVEQSDRIGAAVDCIVLDCDMPGVAAQEFLAAMRDHPVAARVPVIALTSVDRVDRTRLALNHNVAAHLAKPPRASALLDAITDALTVAQNAGPPVAVTQLVRDAVHTRPSFGATPEAQFA